MVQSRGKNVIFLAVMLALIVGALAVPANAQWMKDNAPFSFFSVKGNFGLSGAGGGANAFGGSVGWITNGLAIWANANEFSFDTSGGSGYLSGAEIEVDKTLDTVWGKNFDHRGSVYVPFIVGGYGQAVQGPLAASTVLEPVVGIGGGIRTTGLILIDLNVIYRYAFKDTDTGTTVLTTVTGVTGAIAIGIDFQ